MRSLKGRESNYHEVKQTWVGFHRNFFWPVWSQSCGDKQESLGGSLLHQHGNLGPAPILRCWMLPSLLLLCIPRDPFPSFCCTLKFPLLIYLFISKFYRYFKFKSIGPKSSNMPLFWKQVKSGCHNWKVVWISKMFTVFGSVIQHMWPIFRKERWAQ